MISGLPRADDVELASFGGNSPPGLRLGVDMWGGKASSVASFPDPPSDVLDVRGVEAVCSVSKQKRMVLLQEHAYILQTLSCRGVVRYVLRIRSRFVR